MTSRMHWMDSLRGIAILLVLLWHAPAIPAMLGLDMPGWIRSINDFLIPFRMPTLMFLSGLLLQRSLAKPLREYYIGKLQLIAWPYLVWALIHNLTFNAVAPLWHPRAWIATGYLWFLFFVLCYYLVAPLIRWVPPLVTPIACFTLALIVPDEFVQRLLYFGGFFFAGNVAARYRDRFDLLVANGWVAAGGGLAAVILGAWSVLQDVQYHAEYALLSLWGIIAAIHLMQRAGNARWTQPLQFIGRSSIVYYVSHFPIMNAAFMLLIAVQMRNEIVIIVVLLTVAILVGTLLALAKDKPPVSWLFAAPIPRAWLRRRPAQA